MTNQEQYNLIWEKAEKYDRLIDKIKEEIVNTEKNNSQSLDNAYNKGLKDAWELAKKIVLPDYRGGYTMGELENIFGYRIFITVLENYKVQEALAKAHSYEHYN